MQPEDIFDEHYRLIRKIGKGGFSEVWLAEDRRVRSLRVKVALKIYTSAQANPNDVETFIKQFELVYNINHTNLLPPDACGEFNGMLYLVLRYCERGSSYSLLGKINKEDAWNFLHDVACGLEYLHQRNIIHQDIKPDNVLITVDNRYVITDFDISAKARNTLRLGANDPAGTSAYMSPERFGASAAPIMASDIWALGASLYELISANLPFGDLGGLNQKNGANFQTLINPVSEDLKNIIKLCLQEETWDRPTAGEIRKWCDLHFEKKKIRFEKKYAKILQQANKIYRIWLSGAATIVAIVAIVGVIKFLPQKKSSNESTENPILPVEIVPPPVNTVDTTIFIRTKEKAIKNFEFAQRKNDRYYYPYALTYCDSALSIIPDDIEMIELKKKIETNIK